jgi:uncharacterized protein YndB with AHSA1/START domain
MSRGGIDGPSSSRHESESGIYGERMTDQVSVTREIGAPAAQVWAMVSDVTRMGEWSPENEGGEWLHGASGPEPGARFRGTNRNGKKQWKTVATIVESQPGRVFSFRVTAPGLKVVRVRSDRDRMSRHRDLDRSARRRREDARETGQRRRGPRRPQPRGHGTDARAPRRGGRVSRIAVAPRRRRGPGRLNIGRALAYAAGTSFTST